MKHTNSLRKNYPLHLSRSPRPSRLGCLKKLAVRGGKLLVEASNLHLSGHDMDFVRICEKEDLRKYQILKKMLIFHINNPKNAKKINRMFGMFQIFCNFAPLFNQRMRTHIYK